MVPPIKEIVNYKLLVTGFLFLLFLTHRFSSITHNYCYAQSSQEVRVAIMQDAKFFSLKISSAYEVTDSAKGVSLYRGRDLKATVTGYKNGILLGPVRVLSKKVFVKAQVPGAEIVINGRRFKGAIQLINKDDGKLLVVNYVDLEEYIKGILYNEASHYWPMNALEAQAIVSRTYAFYQSRENKARDYDVTNDVYSQVYGGLTSERYRTNKAVEATRGKVLVYQDKVIPAYFHSTCGGHTQDASLLWDVSLPPLKGVVCVFCKDSPHFSWHYVASSEEILESLSKAGYKTGKITEITVLGRNASGRVADLEIKGVKKEIKISAKDFRSIMGAGNIRSANFTVSGAGSDFVFEGLGWGHGVGLCQWGAYFMAKVGRSTEEVLKYYYPGAEIETVKF